MISFPKLPGCLACRETIESALENAKYAKKEWFRMAIESGIRISKLLEDNDRSNA